MPLASTKTHRQSAVEETIARYPDVPRFVIIKTDVQRRGVFYTDEALGLLDERLHQTTGTHIFGARDGRIAARPESLLLRDGSSIITTPTPLEENPYVVDLLDGQPWLFDAGEPVEEVDYWPAPAFYAKTSRSGVPMKNIVSARPQRLNIFPYRYCTFWNNGKGCSFCDIVEQLKKGGKELQIPARLDPVEVGEVVQEALREPGRFSSVFLTSGSIVGGKQPFDDEVDYYIDILKEVGKNFRTAKYPSQLIGTAFTKEQLQRLHGETGLTSYTSDIEVLDEELFNQYCPGKAEWIGYQEWKRRLVDAVEVFGPGRVNTGLVAGIELAGPRGIASEDEALQRTLAEAEDLARQGVSTVFIVWSPRPHTPLGQYKNASLDYYIRLTRGLHALRIKYRLPIDHDSYRNCGNHPDSDLSRLLPLWEE
ncbi:radical SAM protein [Geotalea sp. SG265]|uniref:radical SAM protein n=1 Tax=Geotalea sp. SG265 TaxID=2922867 RepID=UPI001FAEAA33|nr:radical SAM protein [Geotalea sp. SG265]